MQQIQFEKYYNEHSDALMSFAYKLTRSKMEAEDLVQETAIKAYKNFHSFIKNTSFKNWSFTILKNTFITKYRKSKKMQVVSVPVEEMLFAVSPNITNNIKKDKSNTLKYLHECIAQLSDGCRKPFKLYINGYSYKEIAQFLSIPIGTVKSRISYARTKLKKTIDTSKI